MRWLKIAVEDETYDTLKLIAGAIGMSPEEIISRSINGGLRAYNQLIASGREEELKNFLQTPVGKDTVKQMFAPEKPQEPGLWIP